MRSFVVMTGCAASLLFTSGAFAQGAAPESAPPASGSVSASSSSSVGGGMDAPPAHPIALGVVIGYGLNNSAGDGAPESANAYGLGFGIRGGYTFPFKLYLGGTFIYHLGYSKDANGGSTTFRVNPIGVEAGYDFDFGQFQVRPFLGLGLGLCSATISSGPFSADAGGSKFALWPGVLANYNVNENIFVGLDVRYTILTGADSAGSANALGFYANLGYRL